MLPTERKGVQWRGVPSALAGTASSSSALEVVGFLRSIGRNKLFLPPAHPWVCYWKLVELGALLDSFELELDWFSTDVLHPPRGLTELLRGHTWLRWRPRRDQHRGELRDVWSWCCLGALSLVLGALPFVGLTFFHEVGATQRNGSITCFSRQEGWTCFYPKRRNETRLPGPVRIGSDSLSTV